MTTTTLALTTSATGIVRLLRDMYTDSNTYLRELSQNANRAGATEIAINYDAQTGLLEFKDNGRGFEEADWKAFMGIAVSAWASKEALAQKPFGMGVASCFYVSDSVEVFSNRRKLFLDTAKIEHGSTATLTDLEKTQPGTVIHLYLNDRPSIEDFEANTAELFKAFMLPVTINAKAVARPLALNVHPHKYPTEIGTFITKKRLQTDEVGLIVQGFILHQTSGYFNYLRGDTYVHLIDGIFRVNVPDRTTLCDDKMTISNKIHPYLKTVYSSHLARMKNELSTEDFVINYWDNARDYCPSILNDLPMPSEFFVKLTQLPRRTYDDDELLEMAFMQPVIYEEDIEGELIFAKECYGSCFCEDPVIYSVAACAHLMRAILVPDQLGLDPGHWLNRHLVHSSNVTINVIGAPKAKAFNSGSDIVWTDELSFVLSGLTNAHGDPLDDITANVNNTGVMLNDTLYYPLSNTCVQSELLCYMNDYSLGNDHFELDHSLLESEMAEFQLALELCKAGDLNSLIKSLLEPHTAIIKEFIKGMENEPTVTLSFE